MSDDKECNLIDVEREEKSLSMLMIKVSNKMNWNKIYSILLIGLINEIGKWREKVIDDI